MATVGLSTSHTFRTPNGGQERIELSCTQDLTEEEAQAVASTLQKIAIISAIIFVFKNYIIPFFQSTPTPSAPPPEPVSPSEPTQHPTPQPLYPVIVDDETKIQPPVELVFEDETPVDGLQTLQNASPEDFFSYRG